MRTITKLYLVYDTVAEEIFGSIIRCANDEVARRSFHDLLNAKDSPIAAHRGDYNLLWIADINSAGWIQNHGSGDAVVPITIAKGQDWLDANKEN